MNSVLITGCSTGIGKACALYLAEMEYRVFAGVRKNEDALKLEKESNGKVIPVILDVTKQETIDSIKTFIEEETEGKLYGLVNNAGVGCGGALEVTLMTKIREVMEVNLIGLLAITKAFIPLIRSAKGRIINIGSTSGFIAAPGSSVYAASKFAVRAISDALRLELKPFGIKTILVAPGAIESEIWDKTKAYKVEMRNTITPEVEAHYGPLKRFGDKIPEMIKKQPAIEVAKAVEHGLTSKRPKRYYIVGNDARSAAIASGLPKPVLDWLILSRINNLSKE